MNFLSLSLSPHTLYCVCVHVHYSYIGCVCVRALLLHWMVLGLTVKPPMGVCMRSIVTLDGLGSVSQATHGSCTSRA
jgi:hypothetical protein